MKNFLFWVNLNVVNVRCNDMCLVMEDINVRCMYDCFVMNWLIHTDSNRLCDMNSLKDVEKQRDVSTLKSE